MLPELAKACTAPATFRNRMAPPADHARPAADGAEGDGALPPVPEVPAPEIPALAVPASLAAAGSRNAPFNATPEVAVTA